MSVETGDTPPGPPSDVSTSGVEETHIMTIYERVMETFPQPETYGFMPHVLLEDDTLAAMYGNAARSARNMTFMLMTRIRSIRIIEEYVRGKPLTQKIRYYRAIAQWQRDLDALTAKMFDEIDPSDTATTLQ